MSYESELLKARIAYQQKIDALTRAKEAETPTPALTVAQLITLLQNAPPNAVVRIYRGGAYSDALSIECIIEEEIVYISDRGAVD